MAKTAKPRRNRQAMTPLWLISIFLSLSESVTGLALTKASGEIQVALTAFVIVFPVLIAFAFFIILWTRPYVLYPPGEFGSGGDFAEYVRAMTKRAEVASANAGLEMTSLRAGVQLGIEEVTSLLKTALTEQVAQAEAHLRHERTQLQIQIQKLLARRDQFESNAKFSVEVVEVTVMYDDDE